MKHTILGALLVGALAGQGAFAEIRTFDFTANVSSLATAGNPAATAAAGIVSGTTVALGDVITGRFAFDDLGRDFSGATAFVGFNPALTLHYTFMANGTRVEVAPALWSHSPGMAGGTDLFNVVGANAARTVASSLLLYSPADAFSWDLGNGSKAQLAITWQGTSLNASLSSLAEVSPVPEPSTYGMLLLGAAVVGGAARRHAARSAA
jgi:hypothetical protein